MILAVVDNQGRRQPDGVPRMACTLSPGPDSWLRKPEDSTTLSGRAPFANPCASRSVPLLVPMTVTGAFSLDI